MNAGRSFHIWTLTDKIFVLDFFAYKMADFPRARFYLDNVHCIYVIGDKSPDEYEITVGEKDKNVSYAAAPPDRAIRDSAHRRSVGC